MSPSASTSLIIGERTCKLLQSAGPAFPVPGIGAAAQAALAIIEIAQTVRKNREDFIAIGRTCCSITATLIERVQGQSGRSHDAILQQDAKQLQEEMRFIQKRVRKYGKKPSLWRRIFNHHADKEAIQQCRDRLREALDLFGLQSNIELRKQVAALSGQTTEGSNHPESAPSLPNPPASVGSNLPQHAQHMRYPQYQSAPSIMYNYVQGNVNNTTRDDSFNVSGNGNNINLAFAR